MKLKMYQVDAFTDRVFSGNPAAVCPLDTWLGEDILQKIAMENNLAETAFFVKRDDGYEIRWFTPTIEVDLCGHATLAAALVLFNYENHGGSKIDFYSRRSGHLIVTRKDDLLTLNFPSDIYEKVDLSPEIIACFDREPLEGYKGKSDYMLVFRSEKEIRELKPAFHEIIKLSARGVIVTAKGDRVDFVSRFFAPQSGINEDPVTGSAHTTLTPYWAKKIGKNDLTAIQLSQRVGHLTCRHLNERVEISGKGKEYLIGDIFIE